MTAAQNGRYKLYFSETPVIYKRGDCEKVDPPPGAKRHNTCTSDDEHLHRVPIPNVRHAGEVINTR